eukprot:m.48886 g.48886  ORF g.48886 m.48886 type:complete len:57 (+) comp33937_c0_seq1:24-194(+)
MAESSLISHANVATIAAFLVILHVFVFGFWLYKVFSTSDKPEPPPGFAATKGFKQS